MKNSKLFLNFIIYIYIYYFSIYVVHLCLFSCWRRFVFFSSFAFANAPHNHEAPEGHSVMMDDLCHHCHTYPSVMLIALTTILFYDVNFADSYEYIRCTASSSFSPSSTTCPPTTSSSKTSQVNSSSSSLYSTTTIEACDLMQANVCRITRTLVTWPFIDYILWNIRITPVDLLSTYNMVID
jgi:hypothetical protein